MANALGVSGGGTWWSVMTVSMPASASAEISSAFEIPQSTVTTRRNPSSMARRTNGRERPWPKVRLPTSTLIELGGKSGRRPRYSTAAPLSPSTSKSPWTKIRSLSFIARRIREMAASMPRSRNGEWSSFSPGSIRCSHAAPPRCASRIAKGREQPREVRIDEMRDSSGRGATAQSLPSRMIDLI